MKTEPQFIHTTEAPRAKPGTEGLPEQAVKADGRAVTDTGTINTNPHPVSWLITILSSGGVK